MRRQVLLVLPLAAALLSHAPVAPVAPVAPGDGSPSNQEFSQLLSTADKEFAQKDYIASAKALQQGILLANGKLRSELMAVMPMRPRGFGVVAMPQPRIDPRDPIGAAVAMNPDRPVEQRYRRDRGVGEIRIVVSPNSPAALAAARALSRAEDDPDSELVESGTRVGVLTTRRADFTIRFVLGDGHLVEVRAHGAEPEVVKAMIDARFLDRVARILGA